MYKLYLYRLPGSAVFLIELLPMSKSPKFFVHIQVKPYVRRFLEMNYGYPIVFTDDTAANRFFLKLLSKPSTLRDNAYSDQLCTYTEEVEVVISEHVFFRNGWELTKTDTVAFGRYFEDRVKVFMRSFVGLYRSIGLPLKESILKFQDRFGFDEDTWSYQTIKKDFYRNGNIVAVDFDKEIFKKLEEINARNLYNLGTICKKIIQQYEDDK